MVLQSAKCSTFSIVSLPRSNVCPPKSSRIAPVKMRARIAAPPKNSRNIPRTVTKSFVFISCGQYTAEERRLGNRIAALVTELTGHGFFFADQVQDLGGLDTNILNALRDCVALIVVMHPRGTISHEGVSRVRASVWIEQEIAIATYIQRVDERTLPIIAFIHRDVGREGIRELLSLNPTRFGGDADVLSELRNRLPAWRALQPFGVHIELKSDRRSPHDDHPVRQLSVTLVNDAPQRITTYTCDIWIPSCVLRHDNRLFFGEVQSARPHHRHFRLVESDAGSAKPRVIEPRDNSVLAIFDYCTKCAAALAEFPSSIGEEIIDVIASIEGREYGATKSIKDLAIDAEGRG